MTLIQRHNYHRLATGGDEGGLGELNGWCHFAMKNFITITFSKGWPWTYICRGLKFEFLICFKTCLNNYVSKFQKLKYMSVDIHLTAYYITSIGGSICWQSFQTFFIWLRTLFELQFTSFSRQLLELCRPICYSRDPLSAILLAHWKAQWWWEAWARSGSELSRMGIPKDSILQYETAVKSGKYVLIAHGSDVETVQAREIISRTDPEALQEHQPATAGSIASAVAA